MKRIVVTGPESTGKSTLAQELAKYYQTVWVPEFARDYLNQLDRPYRESDLLEIARGQLDSEDSLAPQARNDMLICDTNLFVIKIWSEFKYNRCDPWIIEKIGARKYDLYLLTDIDLPWAPDPQREHPHLRRELFEIHYRELQLQQVPFETIGGDSPSRLQAAIACVDQLLP